MGRPVTTVSTKGHIIVPKTIRDHRGWAAGTKLVVEETARGVLLREDFEVPERTASDVFGILKYDGPPVSLDDMEKAIEIEVKRRHDRGRYKRPGPLAAGDDVSQQTKVRRLFEKGRALVPVTVMLAAEWVLRASYRLDPQRIMQGFKALAGVSTVTLQSRQEVLRATAWCSGGLDFADALHLATANEASRLLTFDRAFVGRSKGVSPVGVVRL